jgi:hypothetical protein
VFNLDGIAGSQREYIEWLIRASTKDKGTIYMTSCGSLTKWHHRKAMNWIPLGRVDSVTFQRR